MNPSVNWWGLFLFPGGSSPRRAVLLAGFAVFGCLMVSRPVARADNGGTAILQFLQPTNGAVFSVGEEVPVMLRAVAPNDVFTGAEVFANYMKIATASYCCPLCPCFVPMEGQELILQIPVPWEGGHPPARIWQGWTTDEARQYRLTAWAAGQNGLMITSAPVTITVVDRTLYIGMNSEGAVYLRIPQGSMVPGGYDAEGSQDLKTWTRLGPFLPGNVAAFYYEVPPASARAMRFYRSVYVPPRAP